MTVAVLRIVDALGERRLARTDFPLAIGGAGCALALVGAPAGPLAWLGLHEDDLFLQPVTAGAVLHNGAPVESSAWLHAGDVITAGHAVLRMRNVDGLRTLLIEDGGAGNVTAPPTLERGPVIAGTTGAGFEAVVSQQYRAAQAPARRSLQRDRRAWLYAGAGVFIALLLWFLATGVAVQVRVDPAGAQVRVGGSWLAPRFGTQLFLRPGRYTLSARATGYAARSVAFEVNGQAGQVVTLALARLPGTLAIELATPGTLRVDAQSGAHPVPGSIELPAGRHQLHIEAPGYLPYLREVTIAGGGSRHAWRWRCSRIRRACASPRSQPVRSSSSMAGRSGRRRRRSTSRPARTTSSCARRVSSRGRRTWPSRPVSRSRSVRCGWACPTRNSRCAATRRRRA